MKAGCQQEDTGLGNASATGTVGLSRPLTEAKICAILRGGGDK